MRTVNGITIIGKYSLPFEAVVPEPKDIRLAFPKRVAELAIRVMSVEESFIKEHLAMGSTPPTRVPVWKVPWRIRIIARAVWSRYDSSRGCICI